MLMNQLKTVKRSRSTTPTSTNKSLHSKRTRKSDNNTQRVRMKTARKRTACKIISRHSQMDRASSVDRLDPGSVREFRGRHRILRASTLNAIRAISPASMAPTQPSPFLETPMSFNSRNQRKLQSRATHTLFPSWRPNRARVSSHKCAR